MGGVAVLHPQLFPADMRSRRFNPNLTKSPSQNPNLAVPDSRRRPLRKGILKRSNNRNTDSSAATATQKLVMGQVKILKRGEEFNDSTSILKEVNDRKVSNNAASTSEDADREASKSPIRSRRVLPKKSRVETEKTSSVEVLKPEDFVVSSTQRLGPDPEIVSNQMKNITECFAGSVLSDSPPPSSVPIPGFFRNHWKDDGGATTDLRRILGLSLC